MEKKTKKKTAIGIAVGVLAVGALGAAPALASMDAKAGGMVPSWTSSTSQPSGNWHDRSWRPRVVVTSARGIVVRAHPRTNSEKVGFYDRSHIVNVKCKCVTSDVGGNSTWFELKHGGWISARYAVNTEQVPTCS